MTTSPVKLTGMQLAWKLPEVLEQNNITVYRLRKTMLENGVNISQTTAYRWSHEMPETLSVSHLTGVLEALRELTGEALTVDALLEVADSQAPLFDKGAA